MKTWFTKVNAHLLISSENCMMKGRTGRKASPTAYQPLSTYRNEHLLSVELNYRHFPHPQHCSNQSSISKPKVVLHLGDQGSDICHVEFQYLVDGQLLPSWLQIPRVGLAEVLIAEVLLTTVVIN
jgi:hypothetical protein